jgi:CheY-like chemotaxis protein/DNA-directed RNA polymerase subunit RPC12/RpoP
MTEAKQAKLLYCLSCGEEVPTYSVAVGNKVEIRCAYCGFTVELVEPALDAILECVVLADDDLLFRRLLVDVLIQEKLAKEAIAHDSGHAFLTECVRRFRDERPITLVVLDILMAPMDGRAVAFALRALEKGFDLPAPVPILFLSSVRADDSLRRMTEDCAPALYLNKGKDVAPPQLAERVKDIVPRLLKFAKAA